MDLNNQKIKNHPPSPIIMITYIIIDFGTILQFQLIDVPTEEKMNELDTYLLTWILLVVSKQLRLLYGQVRDSTTLVNSLGTQMSELVKDDIAS